jgi:hypothetical protein
MKPAIIKQLIEAKKRGWSIHLYQLILPKLEAHYTYFMISAWLSEDFDIQYSERKIIDLIRRLRNTDYISQKNATGAVDATVAKRQQLINQTKTVNSNNETIPTVSLSKALEEHKRRVEENRKNTVGRLPKIQ